MALEKCPECGGKLSSTASRCPHCGIEGADLAGAKLGQSCSGCLALGAIWAAVLFLLVVWRFHQ